MKNLMLLAVLLLLSVSAAQADESGAAIWDIYCNVDFAYEGDETLTLFVLPAGNGFPFSQAYLPDGSFTDATLRVQILDYMGDPVASFPAEDMWLMSTDEGMAPCIGGSCADTFTDSDGWTVWAEPMNAGGNSTAPCTMFINGMNNAIGWEDLALQFNSADINGDRVVNLPDLALFADSYFGEYSFAADLHYDGVLNLLDVVNLAVGMGTSCP